MNDEEQSSRRFSLASVLPGTLLSSVVLNIACPYMLYQLLSQHTNTLVALLIATLFPLLGLTQSVIRQRSADIIAVGALIGIGIILLLNISNISLVGDALRPIQIIAALIGILGVVMLASQTLRRPILLYVDRFFTTNNEASRISIYTSFWQASPGYQQMVRRLNLVWSIVQIVLAALVALCTLVLSLDQLQLAAPIAVVGVYIALIVWTIQYRSEHMQRWRKNDDDELTPELEWSESSESDT